MAYYISLLLSILFLFPMGLSWGQNLPESWEISPDGRMLIAGGENDEGFFGQNQQQDIQLSFSQSNWWTLLESNYDSGTDLLATCWINGVQYDSVGVRFKGQTSYRRNNSEKKSFNITLDYVIEGQDVEGYNTLNLNGGWGDNSSMREILYNNLGHNYYMSLKSNYVNLTINGQNWGPYQNVQQFDSDYIREWYQSNNGTIWRAERIGGAGPGGGGRPNFGAGRSSLNYNGPDSSDYQSDYTLKRTEVSDPWSHLIAACDVLNNEALSTLEEELSKVLDIDKTCWYLAHEVLFADDDSYIFKGGMDYYVYYEVETDRIIPMEYDGNSVLGSGNLNWDLFYREDETDFPLMNRMLAVPSIRQRYLAHVRTILQDFFNSTYADPKIDTWAASIDASVQADPKKFYTYSEHLAAITSLKQSIVNRRNFILSDPELSNIDPLNVDQVSYAVNGEQWKAPTALDEVHISTQVSGTAGIASVWLYYGEGFTGPFSRLEMYDDGLHDDGAAMDGQFGGSIPPMELGKYVRYYIEAIANDTVGTRTYEPKGAEHNVYIYQVLLEDASDTSIVINELMAQNDAAIADADGEFDDWLELYNTGPNSVDLSGWTLSDDVNELDKFSFPEGTLLAPDTYLIIWADEDLDQDGLHADFKLSANGESLYLANDAQELVDVINFPETDPDLAYARVPNGTGPFVFQDHTQGMHNGLASSVSDLGEDLGFVLYPNPASDFIRFDLDVPTLEIQFVQLFNMLGELVFSQRENIGLNEAISIAGLEDGLYVFRIGLDRGVISRKFVKN